MGALEAVLALKDAQAQQEQYKSQQLAQASQMFQQARQNAINNQMQMLQYKAGLAERGLVPDASTSSGFRYDPTTLNPMAQYMTGLKMQADAKTAGNKAAYDMSTGMLNNLMNGSGGNSMTIPQSPSIPPGSPLATAIAPSSPDNAIANPIGSATATVGQGQMTPMSQTSSTDPITGQTTGTTTMTNISAKAQESSALDIAKEKTSAQTTSARDTAQMQMVAQGIKNLNEIHSKLSDKGFAGNAWSQGVVENYNKIPNNGELGFVKGFRDSIVPKDVQNLSGKFVSARNEILVKVQPILSQQFGQAGSVRIMESLVNLSKGEFGDLNTPRSQFEGQAEGTLSSLYRIKLASDKYLQELNKAGQPIPKDENSVIQGISANMSDLSPEQDKQLKGLVNNTLGKKATELVDIPPAFQAGQTYNGEVIKSAKRIK